MAEGVREQSRGIGRAELRDESPSTIGGRSLLLARSGWITLAATILGLDAIGIPYGYSLYRETCMGAGCGPERLTPEGLQDLQQVGMSREFYAAYAGAGLPITVTLVFFALAAVIFWQRSEERMALFGSFVLLVFGGASISGTMHHLTEAYPALWFPTSLLNYLGQVSFGIFFYLFPDGSFVPRWTRWLAVAAALLFVADVFFEDSSLAVLTDPLFFLFIGSLVFAQVYRYRRVSSLVQRQQTKWVVFGFSVALTGFMVTVALYEVVPAIGRSGPLGELVGATVVYAFLLLIPLSIAVAILRSRLYDIDIIINRALVYGSLTLMLVGVYFGGVVVLQRVFVALTGQQSTLAVVASTLAIAALFNLLRRRVQSIVDRRFYRRKYDARKTLEAFSSKLRDDTDLDALTDDLVGVVRETMQPTHVSLWLRPDRDPKWSEGNGKLLG